MKEIVVISGKGGTGKTSIAAALTRLYESVIVADCDVDAPDLHILLNPEIRDSFIFKGGKLAIIDKGICTECGKCQELCQFGAVGEDYIIDDLSCEGCGVCAWNCPVEAIDLIRKDAGESYISGISNGIMVHALLNPGEENSGKLVSEVKRKAREIAENNKGNLLLIDGPPGIGCPVIASLTGVDLAIIVTEPSLSGIHDMERVLETADHFGVKCMAVINKSDLNPHNTASMREYFRNKGIELLAEIPFSHRIVEALKEGKTIVDFASGGIESSCIKKIKAGLESVI